MLFNRGFKGSRVEPTDKQVRLVDDIVDALGFDYPEEFTKQAYSDFITEHIEDYKDYCFEINYANYQYDSDSW